MTNLRNVFAVVIISLFSFTSFAQSEVDGNWVAGDQNTVIKIVDEGSVHSGKIISSDYTKAEIGKHMVKDLKQNKKGKWEGQVYSPKRKEYYDAEFTRKGEILEVTISVGFFSKTMEWKKQ